MDRVAIGVDIGGTKILAVAYSRDHGILAQERILINRSAGPDVVLADAISLVHRILSSAQLEGKDIVGVGVGVPGLVSSGVLISSVFPPSWNSVNVVEWFSAKLEPPVVVVDNDANMAGLAEWWVRRADNIATLICLTLGTGVGGAIVLDGQVFRGADGIAGELGHTTVDLMGRPCQCGSRGCLDALVSGTAIAERYKEQVMTKMASSLDLVTAESVASAARNGDILAERILEETSRYLGAGLANFVNVFNPDIIVLAGSVPEIGEPFVERARAEMARRAFNTGVRHVRVEKSRLGAACGAVGSALAALLSNQ